MTEKKVLFTISPLKIMTAKHHLETAGIRTMVIDKMDSAHALPFGGDIELYVFASDEQEARKILIEEEVL